MRSWKLPAAPAAGPVLSRRAAVRAMLGSSALLLLPSPLLGRTERTADASEDQRRLERWVRAARELDRGASGPPIGAAAAAVAEQAIGTPYQAAALEAYLLAGGDPAAEEPLTLSLTSFDCVTLVESCLAIARLARSAEPPTWAAFGRAVEFVRYRGGVRGGYLSRLHYFSEWIADNERRGIVQDLGRELGGVADDRPLRFMGEHRGSYPALADPAIFAALQRHERMLDSQTRWVVPTDRIEAVSDRLRTGDVLAFATSIAGLDVTHTAFAYRDRQGALRVLHAPLSGGAVEVTRGTVTDYVRAIRRATGILVARPLPA